MSVDFDTRHDTDRFMGSGALEGAHRLLFGIECLRELQQPHHFKSFPVCRSQIRECKRSASFFNGFDDSDENRNPDAVDQRRLLKIDDNFLYIPAQMFRAHRIDLLGTKVIQIPFGADDQHRAIQLMYQGKFVCHIDSG
ncbi:MAG TPA: hypothetical protein PKM25_06155 [Candidatus Ozemobacteraceae bacterium]|nr:hypothetical protein [Candidatus Ozemobacteraceae bacterium]